jgi:glucose/arabinose dehydrogenase
MAVAGGVAPNHAPPTVERRYRPSGVDVGPDRAQYISDDNLGRIWGVVYVGERGD